MKATLDIPDELYRQVKARSALEGRPIRAVAIELFRGWLAGDSALTPSTDSEIVEEPAAPWLAIARKHVGPDQNHDLASIQSAAKRGWSQDLSDRLG